MRWTLIVKGLKNVNMNLTLQTTDETQSFDPSSRKEKRKRKANKVHV